MMNITRGVLLILILSAFFSECLAQAIESPQKDNTVETTIEIQKRNSLAIIPVVINNSLRVNLILDPYCQSVILFGKRYQRLLEKSKRPKDDHSRKFRKNQGTVLSISNSVSIGPVMGENVPILVVPNADAMNFFSSVNGVIGTDFFKHFEIIINKRNETMTIKRSPGTDIGQIFVQNQYPFQ